MSTPKGQSLLNKRNTWSGRKDSFYRNKKRENNKGKLSTMKINDENEKCVRNESTQIEGNEAYERFRLRTK